MADDADQQEKTESATPRKLEKAREDGQVARSRELTTFTMLLGGVLSLWSIGGHLFSSLGEIMSGAFIFSREEAVSVEGMITTASSMTGKGLSSLLPMFMFMVVVSLVSPMMLGGFLFSSKSLAPQLSRLNPIKGFSRIFSSQALVELAKVIAKLGLLGTVAVVYISARARDFMALLSQPLEIALQGMLTLCVQICAVMVLSMIVVIAIDVPYQLWNHSKQLRMTKEEIKQEHKESDGDPHLKAHIRGQQQAMARRRMMSSIPTADVIITNPTHYAVALSYNENSMGAPRVVAKGMDEVAARIRELGREHEVPLLEAPPLARSLYRFVDLDREIPAELFSAVAEVMAWAVSLKRTDMGSSVLPEPRNPEIPESMRVD